MQMLGFLKIEVEKLFIQWVQMSLQLYKKSF